MGGSGAWQWSQYPSPYNTDNVFSVGGVNNSCDGVRISEIAANHSNQFIELYNQSTESIDVSGCQLQTNRSETARYVFPNETFINADDYIAVYVSQSGLSLTKTTTGTVYLLSSDGATEVDAKSYENLNEGTSLSLIGGMWRQTFAVTPGANNQHEEFLPCAEGYIRNTETGRCNKRLVATVAKPCLSTQYRSEETGRCRNVTANSSSLKACEPHQYRSPETNRCRNVTRLALALFSRVELINIGAWKQTGAEMWPRPQPH